MIAPCLRRALAESDAILNGIKDRKHVRVRMTHGEYTIARGCGSEDAYAYAHGWLKGAIAQHIGGHCCCGFSDAAESRVTCVDEPTDEVRR